jgi:superfamily II DNA/RNA helicase
LTTFAEFGLAEAITRALAEEKYETPTPIQAQTIPLAMTGGDIIGIAQTGTGKTAAFALPILNRVANDPKRPERRHCRVLVLSPTRELSGQILDSFRAYGRHMRLQTALAIGGVPMGRQVRALMNGVDILVATPGRLLDLVQQNALRLNNVEVLVLDEADRMLDMGFIHDIRKIVAKVPAQRQTLMFSATMPKEIAELAAQMLKSPQKVAVTPESTTVERITQRVIHLDHAAKAGVLAQVLREEPINRALVFTRTKHGADKVVRALAKSGIAAEAIHGNKSQSQRERVLAAFRDGRIRTLVATDIAARGIDVDGVSHVINYDLPNIPESYVHRIGRTARAGADGIAISFCSRDEAPFLRDIERTIRITIPSTDQRGDQRQPPMQPNRQHHGQKADGNGQPNGDGNGQRNGKNRRRQRRPYPGNNENGHNGHTQAQGRGQGRRNGQGRGRGQGRGKGQGRAETRQQSNPDQISTVGFMRAPVRDHAKPADAGSGPR